jgi:hypothetical protein
VMSLGSGWERAAVGPPVAPCRVSNMCSSIAGVPNNFNRVARLISLYPQQISAGLVRSRLPR